MKLFSLDYFIPFIFFANTLLQMNVPVYFLLKLKY